MCSTILLCDDCCGFIIKPEMLIAVLALIVSFGALWSQREHNIKSFKPIGLILQHDWEDYLYVKIKNAGTGPLIFISLKVYDSKNRIEPNIIKHMPKLPDFLTWSDYLLTIDNKVLTPGGEIMLLELSIENVVVILADGERREEPALKEVAFSDFRDKVRKALSDLTVEIEYKDIYDNKIQAKQELNVFKRHFTT